MRLQKIKSYRLWMWGFLIGLLTFGCASKPLPNIIYPKAIYPIGHYPMSAESEGLAIVAVPFAPGRDIYADPAKQVEKQGGLVLNVLEAGVLPIKLIIWNHTKGELLIDPDQIPRHAVPVVVRFHRAAPRRTHAPS